MESLLHLYQGFSAALSLTIVATEFVSRKFGQEGTHRDQVSRFLRINVETRCFHAETPPKPIALIGSYVAALDDKRDKFAVLASQPPNMNSVAASVASSRLPIRTSH